METINIKAIKVGQGKDGRQYTSITSQADMRYFYWGGKDVPKGGAIQAQVEMQKNFRVIQDFTVLSTAPTQTPGEVRSPAVPRSYDKGKSPDERASIEKQVALKELGESLRSGLWATDEEHAKWRRIFERSIIKMMGEP